MVGLRLLTQLPPHPPALERTTVRFLQLTLGRGHGALERDGPQDDQVQAPQRLSSSALILLPALRTALLYPRRARVLSLRYPLRVAQ